MPHAMQPWAGRRQHLCARCDTELAPHTLACPACQSLVHADQLRQLAARAEALTAAGELAEARQAWQESLALVPTTSRQHVIVAGRVADLDARLAAVRPRGAPDDGAPARERAWLRSGAAGALGLLLVLAGKLKFLLVGLAEAKTLVSMFAFFGVYWSTFGWPLALGLVLSIYVHEMGHVAMLRKLNVAAGAPLFIPGIGALVRLEQRIDDPRTDAAVGLAGPVWGLGAGLAAYGGYLATDARIWVAIAQLTGFINLFNLIPVWQLDGARGFHALSTAQRWAVVVALGAAFLVTGQRLLILIALVALWRAWQRPAGPGDRRVLATLVALVAMLSWMAGLRAVA